MSSTMGVRVVSPEKVVFQGQARSLVAPAWDGQVGVLPGHAPYLTLLGSGVLRVQGETGGEQRFHVAGGVLKVEANSVTVLASEVGVQPA